MKLAQLNLVAQLGFVVFMFLVADTAAIELGMADGFTMEYGMPIKYTTLIIFLIALNGCASSSSLKTVSSFSFTLINPLRN